MKKLFISSFLIVLVVICILFITGNKKPKYKELKKYKSDILCTYNFQDSVDDEVSSSHSNAYITLDKLNVSRIIYQSILEKSSIYSNVDMQKELLTMYDNIDGISYDVYETKNNYVIEITYDYTKLDLNTIKTKLNGILDDASILMTEDKLPITFETLKKHDLKDYECK